MAFIAAGRNVVDDKELDPSPYITWRDTKDNRSQPLCLHLSPFKLARAQSDLDFLDNTDLICGNHGSR